MKVRAIKTRVFLPPKDDLFSLIKDSFSQVTLKEKSIITKNTKAVICPAWRSVDLDTHEDWALAEHLYENKGKIANRINELQS